MHSWRCWFNCQHPKYVWTVNASKCWKCAPNRPSAQKNKDWNYANVVRYINISTDLIKKKLTRPLHFWVDMQITATYTKLQYTESTKLVTKLYLAFGKIKTPKKLLTFDQNEMVRGHQNESWKWHILNYTSVQFNVTKIILHLPTS